MTTYSKLDGSVYAQEVRRESDTSYDREIRPEADELVGKAEILYHSMERLSFHAAVKKWPRLSLYCLGLTSTIILTGYDGALVGSVAGMPEFKQVYGTITDAGTSIIPSHWLALWNISSQIGAMGGALLGGWLGDRIGRRWLLLSSSVFVGCGVALFLVSDLPSNINGRRIMFFIAKTFQGVAIGSLTQTTQTWMSEAVDQALKASVLASFPIFTLLGQIIGSIVIQVQLGVEGRQGYRIGLATQFAFAVPPLVMSRLIPESPAWLLRRGQHLKARFAFDKLEKSKNNPKTDLAFAKLQQTVAREKLHAQKDDISYLQCFKGTNTRRTLIIIFAMCVPECFGLHLVGNATYFLQMLGITAKVANLVFIAGVAFCLISIISSFWTLTMFGRRQLFLSTLSFITIVWGGVGINGATGQEKLIQWWTIISFVLLTATAGLGVWPVSYVVSGETSSLRLRSRSQGIGWTVSSAFAAIIGIAIPYLYNADAANLGAKTGFVYLGLSGIAAVIAFFFLPEMKGRSAAEIDEMFELDLPARQFRQWSFAKA